MKPFHFFYPLLTLLGFLSFAAERSALFAAESKESDLPANWYQEWNEPSARMRPLQMIHGGDLTDPSTSLYYRDKCGLGGLVVNVGGEGYIRDQQNWDRFTAGVKNASDAGLRLWIYDEDGYPSLEAGGVVLEEAPELVSQELVWDPEAAEPFFVRECYEYTHSSNNFSAARKYPNPLNPAATQKFLEVTHQRYLAALGSDLYGKIEAFFTDEPSMMAANLGVIQFDRPIPIVDPIDPQKKNLPMLPWTDDLEQRYQERYGESITPHLLSLFTGEEEADQEIRARYWSLIEQLYAERYFGQIAQWCHNHPGPVSSGHTLHEEILIGHVPLDGNKLTTLKSFDIPGLDLLDSEPKNVSQGSWLAAAFPCSAARIRGIRRTMSETSDFVQRNGPEKKDVPLDMMTASAAWQAAWGVTDFCLYYRIEGKNNPEERNEESHRAYCEFVGRLNAILLDAEPIPSVLLYYPIETMQREFVPTKDRVNEAPVSDKMRETIRSFNRVGNILSSAQIPFTVVDAKSIDEMSDEALAPYQTILFPYEADPPESVITKLTQIWKNRPHLADRFILTDKEQRGVQPDDIQRLITTARLEAITPTSTLCQGIFQRDGRRIFLIANLQSEPYQDGFLLRLPETETTPSAEGWTILNPQTGEILPTQGTVNSEGQLSFALPLQGRETLLLVEPR